MTEGEWGDEAEVAAPKKRRFPGWLKWGCGCGCLLTTLLAITLSIVGYRFFREATDPALQWPRLREVLYFEERPEGLELEFGWSLGMDQFKLSDGKGLGVTVTEYPRAGSADYEKLMDPDIHLPLDLGKPVDPERGALLVQGKEVPFLRFTRIKPEPEEGGLGAGIRLDLTAERRRPRTIELRRLGAVRVEDSEITTFLAPFDVWREP